MRKRGGISLLFFFEKFSFLKWKTKFCLNFFMFNFHNQTLTFAFILFLIINHAALSNEILFCKIEKEIENDKLANKKLYKDKPLKMHFQSDNDWLYEIKKKDWFIGTNEAIKNTNISFKEDSNFFYFNLMTYQSPQKKKIELKNIISLEKQSGYLKFSKEYHDHNGNIFFTSVVEGFCNRK